MKFLLLYKGDFGRSLRGPELRYFSLARELVASGDTVYLSGRSAERQGVPDKVIFVKVSHIGKLARCFFDSEVILLHGGGPLIIFFSLISGFLGKKIILDCYVPHWIELDEIVRKTKSCNLKFSIKAYFNVMRSFFGVIFFNAVIVANQRQLDLMRGMMSPFWLTREFSRIKIVPYGCDKNVISDKCVSRELLSKLAGENFQKTDFLIGWLGGAYGWFDIEIVVGAISSAIEKNSKIKIIFFGVLEAEKKAILERVSSISYGNIFFLPWVDFSERLNYWSGLDISLVWGGKGYENDYASRTRNFDCLSIGLPIVQNEDSEWGIRLEKSGAGKTVTLAKLPDLILELSYAPDSVAQMRKAMSELASQFQWENFAKKITKTSVRVKMKFLRRCFGLLVFLLTIPPFMFSAVFILMSLLMKKFKKMKYD